MKRIQIRKLSSLLWCNEKHYEDTIRQVNVSGLVGIRDTVWGLHNRTTLLLLDLECLVAPMNHDGNSRMARHALAVGRGLIHRYTPLDYLNYYTELR